jgi:hypothetical protein
MVTFDLLPGKASRYPVEGRLGESQGWSGHNSGEEKNLGPCWESNNSRSTDSYFTVWAIHAIRNISSCLLPEN